MGQQLQLQYQQYQKLQQKQKQQLQSQSQFHQAPAEQPANYRTVNMIKNQIHTQKQVNDYDRQRAIFKIKMVEQKQLKQQQQFGQQQFDDFNSTSNSMKDGNNYMMNHMMDMSTSMGGGGRGVGMGMGIGGGIN